MTTPIGALAPPPDGDLTELPSGLPGKVWRSPMPFSSRDHAGVFSRAKGEGVTVVVVLTAREECARDERGRNLLDLYADESWTVIHVPITDFGKPADHVAFRDAVLAAHASALAGKHVMAHCYAGHGRTGMFLACLARRVFQFDGPEAIAWVRRYVPAAVEGSQDEYVAGFVAE